MKQIALLLAWQGGITAMVVLVFAIACRIPWVASYISNKEVPILGTVFIMCAWTVVGAIMGIWVESWFVYGMGSALLGVLLVCWAGVVLSYSHQALMNASGPATMGLMFPLIIGIFIYPLGGLVRLALRLF